MKGKPLTGLDKYLDESLRKDPAFAKEYFWQLAELPLPTQLVIARRHRGLTQSDVARALGVKPSHVARAERVGYDSKISSIEAQARAMHCRLAIVPDEYIPMLHEELGYTEAELDKIEMLAKAGGKKSFKSARAAIAYIKSL